MLSGLGKVRPYKGGSAGRGEGVFHLLALRLWWADCGGCGFEASLETLNIGELLFSGGLRAGQRSFAASGNRDLNNCPRCQGSVDCVISTFSKNRPPY